MRCERSISYRSPIPRAASSRAREGPQDGGHANLGGPPAVRFTRFARHECSSASEAELGRPRAQRFSCFDSSSTTVRPKYSDIPEPETRGEARSEMHGEEKTCHRYGQRLAESRRGASCHIEPRHAGVVAIALGRVRDLDPGMRRNSKRFRVTPQPANRPVVRDI